MIVLKGNIKLQLYGSLKFTFAIDDFLNSVSDVPGIQIHVLVTKVGYGNVRYIS